MIALRAWSEVFRVSNLPTVWTNVAAAWWLSGALDYSALALLLCGASMVYIAGMALNDAFDVAIDRGERPQRPIPSGRLSASAVWIAGLGCLVTGSALLVFARASPWLVAALAVMVIAYNWLHDKSSWTVLLMAACRALLWLLPSTLPNHFLTVTVAVWSGTLFSYIIGVSLLARSEASSRRIDPSPILWLARSLLLAPFVVAICQPQALTNWAALLFFLVMIPVLHTHNPSHPPSVGRTIGWLLALIPLIDAMAVAPARIAIILAAALPLCRMLQRTIVAS